MPMSNLNYDVLTALHNKLEAVTIYDQYMEDSRRAEDEKGRQLLEDLKREDDQHGNALRGELERLVKEVSSGSATSRRSAGAGDGIWTCDPSVWEFEQAFPLLSFYLRQEASCLPAFALGLGH